MLTYCMIDVDVWPGPKPAFITADILGGERQLIDAWVGHTEDATSRVHGSIGSIHKTPIIAHYRGPDLYTQTFKNLIKAQNL